MFSYKANNHNHRSNNIRPRAVAAEVAVVGVRAPKRNNNCCAPCKPCKVECCVPKFECKIPKIECCVPKIEVPQIECDIRPGRCNVNCNVDVQPCEVRCKCKPCKCNPCRC